MRQTPDAAMLQRLPLLQDGDRLRAHCHRCTHLLTACCAAFIVVRLRSSESSRLAFLPKKDTHDVLSIGLTVEDDGAADAAPATAAAAQVRCAGARPMRVAAASMCRCMHICTLAASTGLTTFACVLVPSFARAARRQAREGGWARCRVPVARRRQRQCTRLPGPSAYRQRAAL